jgi:hypothetical protein
MSLKAIKQQERAQRRLQQRTAAAHRGIPYDEDEEEEEDEEDEDDMDARENQHLVRTLLYCAVTVVVSVVLTQTLCIFLCGC